MVGIYALKTAGSEERLANFMATADITNQPLGPNQAQKDNLPPVRNDMSPGAQLPTEPNVAEHFAETGSSQNATSPANQADPNGMRSGTARLIHA